MKLIIERNGQQDELDDVERHIDALDPVHFIEIQEALEAKNDVTIDLEDGTRFAITISR